MDLFDTIFELRQRIDLSRQPDHKSSYEMLQRQMTETSSSHPYKPVKGDYPIFRRCDVYESGANGKKVSPPEKVEYFYRIAGIGECRILMNEAKDRETSDGVAYQKFVDEYDISKNWHSLTGICKGLLSNKRSFSWWTNLDLSDGDVLLNAHKVGLPKNWVGTEILLLRCKTDVFFHKECLHVPTIIDAFNSSIFLATNDAENPKFGHPIWLRHDNEFIVSPIAFEYVSKPIPTEFIEFIPYSFDAETRSKIGIIDIDEPEHLDKLVEFYKNVAY